MIDDKLEVSILSPYKNDYATSSEDSCVYEETMGIEEKETGHTREFFHTNLYQALSPPHQSLHEIPVDC